MWRPNNTDADDDDDEDGRGGEVGGAGAEREGMRAKVLTWREARSSDKENSYYILYSFIYLITHKILIEYLLCARHCFRHLRGNNSEQDKISTPYRATTLYNSKRHHSLCIIYER